MEQQSSVAKRKTWARRLLNGLVVVLATVAAVYFVARGVWRYSGSNQWELVHDRKGVKVYALKEPGTDLTLYKGSVQVHSTMNRAVAWLQDPDTCRDAGCVDPTTIEKVDEQLQYVSMKFNMSRYFRRREFVMRSLFHQVPQTKEIWVEYAAAPEKLPPNDCCFRVTNMANTWRLTPVGDSAIEIEYTMNMDWGGFIPDLLSNVARPKYMARNLEKLEGYLNKDKYRDVKFAFVQEPTPTGAIGQANPPAAVQPASAAVR